MPINPIKPIIPKGPLMTILEQTLIPKNPAMKSEDGIVVTDNFIAVIDGSTSKTNRRHNSRMTNGRYAMTIVSDYVSSMPANTSCHQFCVGVTAAIRKRYLPFWKRDKQAVINHLQQHPEERLCASAAIYSRLRREVWLVGDCKPYEEVLARMRAEKVKELLAEGKTADEILANDVARQSVIPRMLQEMQNQNVTYAVIDGFPIPEQKVSVLTLDFRPWEIVLATDGYPFLCPTLAESEAKLAQQRHDDPLNIGTFKATKGFTPGNNSFDDRTYIRFEI